MTERDEMNLAIENFKLVLSVEYITLFKIFLRMWIILVFIQLGLIV